MNNKLNYNKEKLDTVCKKYDLSLVILHGSYAKGLITANSDIDIALLGIPNIIEEKYFDILSDFSSIFGDKFDPVFINGQEAMISYQIAINGMPLYEKDKGLFNSFKVTAIGRYNDTKKFRILEKQYIKSIIERMA